MSRVAHDQVGDDPCAFSPGPRYASKLAKFYVSQFPPGSRVLDIGFGQGNFLNCARKSGLDATGFDRDPALVSAAQRAGLKVVRGDAAKVADYFEPASFDGVLATHLIEHLAPADVRALLEGVATLLVPGGTLVLATPNIADPRVAMGLFWWDPTHVRPYPAQAVQRLAAADTWQWVADGFEPAALDRSTPALLLKRLRYGRGYGRSGGWYKLRRR